ncbi:MAG TPA: site-specific integrase [Thermoleophilaceae bacterium]
MLRDEFRAELRTGRARVEGRAARATFAAIAGEWLKREEQLVAVGELAPRTLEAYRSAVDGHLVPHFGAWQVRAITPDDLVAWHAEQRAAGAATWSIKNRWAALRLVLAYAVRRGYFEASPADQLERRERPRAGDARKRFLTDDEMAALLAATAPRYRAFVALGLFAGLRVSEAVGLTWGDVDFDAGRIRVRHQLARGKAPTRVRIKTPAGRRDVVLMDGLASMLRRARLAAVFSDDGDPVLATANRTHVSARNASRAFEQAVERAGLDGVTYHVLRHTFASLLIAQGRDPVFVADQLGHADPAITMRVYAHLFREAKEASSASAQLEAEYGHMLRGG